MPDGPFKKVEGGVRIFLRVAPKAAANRIAGLAETAGGGQALKISVTAAPEDGKANAAVIKLLAKAWKIPKSSIVVVSGATDRNKTLLVAESESGNGLLRRLNTWMERIANE